MKASRILRPSLALALAMPSLVGRAAVFTSDTIIDPTSTAYEGQDIVASNAVLTVDGPHTFKSLRLAAGALLTHSAASNGTWSVTFSTLNELHVLTTLHPVHLANANVLPASVRVRDTNNLVTYANAADYVLTNSGPITTLQLTTNSAIPEGGTVFVSYNFLNTTNAGLNLTVAGDFEIEPGGSVNVDGRGFGGGQGPGVGGSSGSPLSGGGAGHGGNGGLSSSNAAGGLAYGMSSTITNLGSGGGAGSGGAGGRGGGLVQLAVGGRCVLNGTVSANGQNATSSRAGGGAGGSIGIAAQTLSGTGTLHARGGAGEPIHGGGGGGGRIALDFQTNLFAGTISTIGGAGWQRGGAGSILSQSNGTPGVVTFDNGGLAGAASPLSLSGPADVTVQGRTALVVSSAQTVGALRLRSYSSLTTVATNNATLNLSVTGDAQIEAGAIISLDGKGSPANQGSGAGQSGSVGSGAGHGGYGGDGIAPTSVAAGGNYYGSMTAPTTCGSGGRTYSLFPGGAGGGAVRMTVTGNLQLDGRISSDGTAGGGSLGGGASGGSVWLTLGGFSGAGSVSANGGSGGLPCGGGGAGGRIAITYNTSTFAGNLMAAGGVGAVGGGAGTIYTKLYSSTYADVRADNGGVNGTNTVLDASASYNLTVTGGATLRSTPTSLSLGTLSVGSNSTLLLGDRRSSALVTVASQALVAAGGIISGDGLGSTSGAGTGAGQTSQAGSTGGGHGGFGGRGLGFANLTSSAGGNAYDSTASPAMAGSGGGGLSLGGGAGGAALRMTFSGPLILNGRISANGASTSTNSSGGGSGGALWLTLNNQFSGTGLISADGGTGHLPNGGGGGGGRIALYYGSNSFTGTYSAKGGNGFHPGGAGTVFLKASNRPYPSLIVDNGGLSGTNALTPLDLSSLLDLTLRSGGSLTPSVSSVSLSNLNIGANASLRVRAMTLNVSGTATIAAGGGIFADGANSSGPGNGLSAFSGSSGGGHGGYGGRGAGASGGTVADSTANPASGGGYGGNYPGGPVLGGGTLRMTVTGPMVLDGKLSANGNSATNSNGGGGAGGSVWLTLNQFSGAGSISADGGAAQTSGTGGGGGGGRLAIYFNSNSFTGTLSAKGGAGFAAGGAGTVYLKRNLSQLPDLLADNGGLSGTNTVLDVSSLSTLTITGGALLKPASPAQNLSVVTLHIGTNSSLLTPASGLSLTLNLSGAANIAAGGSISGDGLGSSSGSGSGLGQTATGGSGGAGHAGYGGQGLGNAPTGGSGAGGNAYGSLASPSQLGSGGGGVNSSGGSGGGAININATRSLSPFTLNGRISATGASGSTNNAGGGSGGSVWLTLNQLLGAGAITADGGNGHVPNGGGGGGGRISVSYNFPGGNTPSNGFTGTFSARGGNGFGRGGAGTIYLRTNTASIPIVITDNGGGRGTNTLVLSSEGTFVYDLFVQGGSVATGLRGNPRDLVVRSNAWIAPAAGLSVSRNATFDAGGGMNLNGLGTSTLGAGSVFSRGGGGHGGYGALNASGSGTVYDSAIAPTQSGSAGGGASGLPLFGGRGGGAARLTIGTTLVLNGALCADGLTGDYACGGGAGGAVWLEALTLAGSGQITANGGAGNGTAGGGGGGRVAIYSTTNLFTGTISAGGGGGALAGGAGTVYFRDPIAYLNNFQRTSLRLDNCGLAGTNTPLSTTFGLATNVTVTGGAIAEFQGAIPAFSNLVVSAGGRVTTRRTDTNLHLALLGDLIVGEGGGVVVDANGFARASGPGAGGTYNNQGAGGSYGGWGGDSGSGAFSGPDYGSATMPVDRGSGGGSGAGPASGGSEGGGAIHLAVAGTLALDGLMSADGGTGWQDDSGGGSGGSVWISAKKFTGHGTLAAIGGDGEFYGGGGGGGGRIAIYSPMNTFTGLVSVAGGDGAYFGEAGTVFTSGGFPGLEVVSQSPTGLVNFAVGEVMLEFSEAVNPLSVSASDFQIYTPYGSLASANLSWSLPAPATLRISFPPQHVPGNYRLEVGPLLEGFLAPRMSQVYTGAFTAVLPLLSGTVTDTNGQPVPGVWLQPNGGLRPATTDVNGNYSLGVPGGWNGIVTPAFGNFRFAPGSRSYGGVSADVTGQNYLMVATLAPLLQIASGGTNLFLNWSGLSSVTYQVYWSTNLNDATWYPLGAPVAGTNGLMRLEIPISDEPEKYFRLNAQN